MVLGNVVAAEDYGLNVGPVVEVNGLLKVALRTWYLIFYYDYRNTKVYQRKNSLVYVLIVKIMMSVVKMSSLVRKDVLLMKIKII